MTEYISLAIGLYYWGVCSSWVECHFSLSLVYQSVLLSEKWSNTRMLVTFGTCFKQHFDTRYCFYAISHLLGCFCPWTFFQNIGFNMVQSGPFMSHLVTQLGHSAGEFQTLQLIVVAAFGVGILVHLFGNRILKQQLGCRFDLMDSNDSLPMCLALWEMVLY